MEGARFEAIKPLLESQSYIGKVEWGDLTNAKYDFSTFRHDHVKGENLADWQARHLGVRISSEIPWLTVKRNPISFGRTVFAHSGRYPNPRFPWRRILLPCHKTALFVGLPSEHREFNSKHGVRLEFCPTNNLLEVAEIIAGADRLICNQSSPFWIAAGIGCTVFQETFQHSPNSYVRRKNMHYSGTIEELQLLLSVL